jgi:hypothetical protein
VGLTLIARSILVEHGHGVVHPRAGLLRLRVIRHLMHNALMLQLDHRGTVGPSFHRVFQDGLPLELFSPFRRLMPH